MMVPIQQLLQDRYFMYVSKGILNLIINISRTTEEKTLIEKDKHKHGKCGV
jgi:hypothetical protein